MSNKVHIYSSKSRKKEPEGRQTKSEMRNEVKHQYMKN